MYTGEQVANILAGLKIGDCDIRAMTTLELRRLKSRLYIMLRNQHSKHERNGVSLHTAPNWSKYVAESDDIRCAVKAVNDYVDEMVEVL